MERQTVFIETDCTINFNGQKFTSGGAFLLQNKKTGKLGGILYSYEKTGQVGNWNGDIKVNAKFGKVFHGNMCRRQYVWFKYAGKNFFGINYSYDHSDLLHVKEVRS